MIPLNRVLPGEVCEVLRGLPSDFVHAGVADPPYGCGLKGVDWDAQPNYGVWIEEAFRVLKPGGTIYVFGKPEIIADHWHRFPKPKDLLAWHYPNRVLPQLNWWQPTWDAVVAFSKGKPRFYRDQVRGEYSRAYANLVGKRRPPTPGRYGTEDSVYADNGGTLPRDVIIGPAMIGRHGAADRVDHPTQKPLWLMEKLILSVTRDGESILDLFSGSGTTSAAAARLGRRWLAIERDPRYCELITARVAAAGGTPADEKFRVDFDPTSKGDFDGGSEK